MLRRKHKNVCAGGLFVVLGLAVAIKAVLSYHLGTVEHMGPGMFPAVLGFLLAGLGTLILVPALFMAGELPRPDYRQFVAAMVGILLFAATVDVLGMVPAIFLVTIAAALADNKLGVVGTIVLAIVMSIISVLIFRIGLGIQLDIVRWPF